MVTPARQVSRVGLLTVDAAASHLQVHRKTVLRYIRDGRLPATKIGKAYRIQRIDLDTFTGAPASATAVAAADTARVTSIVDVPGVGSERAAKLSGAITNALHSGRDQRNGIQVEVIYDAEQARLKIIIVGTVADTSSLLGLIEIWVDQLTP